MRYSVVFLAITACIVSFFSFLIADAYALGLNIDTPRIVKTVKPSELIDGVIEVNNSGEQEIMVNIYAEDWDLDKSGQKVYKPAGTLPNSCSQWITFDRANFNLAPDETRDVKYSISVPQDAEGGNYSMIFFETDAGMKKTDAGTFIRLIGRVGSIVLLEIEGRTDKSAELSQIRVSEIDENKPLKVQYNLKNMGNALIKAMATINIIDKEGNLYGRGEAEQHVYATSGSQTEGYVEYLGSLPEGQYDVILTLDVGENAPPLVSEASIDVTRELRIISVKPAALEYPAKVSIVLANTGNLNANFSGGITVYMDGQKTAEGVIDNDIILCREEKELNVALDKNLPKGDYKAQVQIKYNGTELTEDARLIIE
jgi:hypothetical protein